MFHPLAMLITFNIVGYITERELNNWCGVSSICNLSMLHIELHLNCSAVCFTLPCHVYLNRTCIILVCASWHVYACVFTILFASFRLFLSLASVSFRSCEDSFDYIRLSSSWTRSSSYRNFRQDDYYPRYHFYLCLLVAPFCRYAALPITCLPCLPYCHVSL